MGSLVVQETLARAYYAFPEMHPMPPLRPWVFRIAHHRALDHLRRYERGSGQSLEDVPDPEASAVDDAEDVVAAKQAARAALHRFLRLPPAQRSCVILKDVLGDSVEEIAGILDLSRPHRSTRWTRPRSRPTPRR